MMTDKEHFNAQILTERDALYPSEPSTDTNEVIIRGEDAYTVPTGSEQSEAAGLEPETSEHTVHALFDSMFDQYVRSKNDPSITTEVGTGETTRFGVPKTRQIGNEEIARIQYGYLHKYVEGSIVSGDLAVSSEFLRDVEQVSLKTLGDAYIKQGIATAEIRYQRAQEAASLRQPGHIEVVNEDPDPETTSKFVEVLEAAKVFGAGVLSVFGVGQHFRSGPIPIHTKVLPTPESVHKS